MNQRNNHLWYIHRCLSGSTPANGATSAVHLPIFLSLLLLSIMTPLHAQESPKLPRVRLMKVHLPITGNANAHIQRGVEQLISETDSDDVAKRPILILKFEAPNGQSGEGSQFERALWLARYLASPSLNSIRTVAYLPQSVLGHAVLPVLACEEIVIGEKAEFGAAGIDEPFIDATMKSSYIDIAGRRRTIPPAVALGMLDKQTVVVRTETSGDIRYRTESELTDLQKAEAGIINTVKEKGDFSRFTSEQLCDTHQFARGIADSNAELAEVLKIPIESLQSGLTPTGLWQAVQIDIRGTINDKNAAWVQTSLQTQLSANDANFVCVVIDSPGGSPAASMQIANYLAALDDSEVRTVAVVLREARADAALIALACDQLVMTEDSLLGGPGAVVLAESDRADLVDPVKALATSNNRRWSLLMALADNQTETFSLSAQSDG